MTRGKPLRLREPAERDLLSAFEHDVKDAPQVASDFTHAFEHQLASIPVWLHDEGSAP